MDCIEFKNASFRYPNGTLANEELNLRIEQGERVAIIGQNGAGKTTAVKMMNGLHLLPARPLPIHHRKERYELHFQTDQK